MRKFIVSVIGLILIAGAGFGAKYLIDSKKAPEKKITKEVKIVVTDTVQNTDIQIKIPSNGNLMAKERVAIYSEVAGLFKKTNKLFKTGQIYKKGEVIISIDSQEFYAQVQSARSNLKNQIMALMPDLRLDYAQSYAQWQKYLDNWNVSFNTPRLPAPVDQKERYFITGRNIYTTYYNLKNLENRLAKFTIRAPFDGVLTDAMITEGSLVRNGQQLGEFINLGTYEVEVAISSGFAGLLKLGEKVEMSNILNDQIYVGEVTRINGKVDQATQTISTIIEVSDSLLKEGMYLKANLDVQEISNAIEINRGLLQDGNKIFTMVDNQLVLVDVTPVHFTEKTVVLKGLENGTVFISKTVPGAYEGMLVKVEELNELNDRKGQTAQTSAQDQQAAR